jgi:Rieske Fe-S protein
MITRPIVRRTFLGFGLVLVGVSRHGWAQSRDAPSGYVPLSRPVRIPLDEVRTPWHTVAFTAEAIAAAPGGHGRRVVMNGVLYRKVVENDSSGLTAVCVTCPHELCPVALVTDPERLVRMGASDAKSPLFECGCHFSKFDAREDGEWVSGVAYRGLFRFLVGAISTDTVEITHIEEEALSVV